MFNRATNDLEPGKKDLLHSQGVQMSTGQHCYVSVIVAKCARPGWCSTACSSPIPTWPSTSKREPPAWTYPPFTSVTCASRKRRR